MAVFTPKNIEYMIEIILLIFLVNRNGVLARENELNSRKWKIQTVLYWFAFEIPMILISMTFSNNILVNSISGGLAGLIGYFVVKSKLEKAIELSKGEPNNPQE